MRRVLVGVVVLGFGFAACTLDQTGAGAGGQHPDAAGGVGGSAGGGTGGTAGTAGASGAGGSAGSGGQGCFPGPGEKACGELCVSLDDPAYGCSADACSACVTPNASSQCAAGACAIASCASQFEDCNLAAADGCEINTQQDPRNCGSCGNDCFDNTSADNWRCEAGVCEVSECPVGFEDCNQDSSDGCEVDLSSSAAHCGFCGNGCSLTNAVATCEQAACVVDSCSNGFGDCDNTDANGCEVVLTLDADNCGGCGRACSGTQVNQRTCAGGLCTSSCNAPFGNCGRPAAPAADDGCELNLSNNTANCGSCGAACGTAHSTGRACANSLCVHTCEPGWGDCQARPGATDNGCETNLTSSVNHCGGCGQACSTAGSSSRTCSAGQCAHTCSTGFGDCDGPRPGATDNGCERNLNTDVDHCGACAAPCSSAQVATRSCSGGQCAPTCSTGRGDCNGPEPGNADDGCEVNLTNDPEHCGTCPVACQPSQTCSQSACSGAGGTGGAGGGGAGGAAGSGTGGVGGT